MQRRYIHILSRNLFILLIAFLFCSNLTIGNTSNLNNFEDSVDTEIAKAQQVLDESSDVLRETNAASNKIAELTSIQKANEAALRNIEALNESLKEFQQLKIKEKLTNISPKLTSTKAKLEEIKGKIASDSTNEQDIKNREKLDAKIKEFDSQIKLVDDYKDTFKKNLERIYDCVKAIYTDNSTILKPLKDINAMDDGIILLRVLPSKLGDFSDVINLQERLSKDWDILAPLTDTMLGLTDAQITMKHQPIELIRDSVTSDINGVSGKLDGWFKTLNDRANDLITSINTFLNDFFDKPENKLVDAATKAQQANDLADALQQIVKEWIGISNAVKNFDAGFAIETISKKAQDIDESAIRLSTRKALLLDAPAGDMTNFTTEFIPLYYFTDIPNLMKALNPAMYEIRDVGGLRDQSERLRRDLNEADILLPDAQAEVSDLNTRLKNLREELRVAEAKYLSSNDLFSIADRKLKELTSRTNPDAGRVTRETQRKEDLDKDNKANKENRDRLKNEQTGLPSKISAAEDRLLLAQERVRRARTNTLLLAQTESEAFAKARDNEAVYVAPIIGTTRDPLKKVFMFAFGNRKMIFIRGLKENVDKAKAAIALFDRPAPQARLTLWTLELNSTADYNGAKKFARVLPIIENELANSRSRIAASLSFLRDSINKKVNEIANGKLTMAGADTSDRGIRWARMHFYQKSVLLRLGFDFGSAANPNPIAEMMLPDPAGTTTLGEALVVLSLASQDNREKVLKDFEKDLNGELTKLGLPPSRFTPPTSGCDPTSSPLLNNCWFASVNRAMSKDISQNGEYNYTSQQKEIIDAIIKSNSIRVIAKLEELLKALKIAQEKRISKMLPSTSAEEDNLIDRIVPILGWLYQEFGITTQEAIKKSTITSIPYKREVSGVDLLRTANAQVARADLMLKQLIDAVDQDIDRHFVQPTIIGLREILVREKVVSVGVLNRTSVISTNRLLARVDARASAQLPLGEETNILQSAQQLAQVVQAGQIGGILGVFGSLNGLPRNDVTEIYGLTTQSQFKVTPIFDPTGQTLRFKFDYVAANLVTEPAGTTNPQLPKIERHTVNTEVELNNLELREISRFDSNSKLGIATRKWGGIPLIKDLPGMSHVPLLGWFVRKSGKSAVIQQSMIFGQTTMYPTIGDMLELLKSGDYLDFASANKPACPACPGVENTQATDDNKKPCPPEAENGVSVTLDKKAQDSLNQNKQYMKLVEDSNKKNPR